MSKFHSEPDGQAIIQQEKAQLDFSKDMSYGDYLHLDALLLSLIHI